MSVVDLGSILKYSSDIEIGQKTSVAQVSSQSGKRVAQRRGPVLYTMTMTGLTYKMDSDQHQVLKQMIISLNYGANTIRFNLKNPTSGGASPTRLISTGTWGGSPATDGANQIGKSLTIKNCEASITTYNNTGDYVQFEGNDKVYQIAGTTVTTTVADSYGTGSTSLNTWAGSSTTDVTGDTTLRINTPLVKPPLDGSKIVVGDDVQFHMSLKTMPTVTYLPGDLVMYGNMEFEEIIAD
jgi:hypothetical protein